MADNLYDLTTTVLPVHIKIANGHFLTERKTKLVSGIPILKNGVKVFTK